MNYLELSSDQADLIATALHKVADDFLAKSDNADTDELINNILAKVADELGISV